MKTFEEWSLGAPRPSDSWTHKTGCGLSGVVPAASGGRFSQD